MSTQDMKGRVALVTGAGVGIGRAVAEALGARGATIGVHYRSSAAEAGAVRDAVRRAGGEGILLRGDLTVESEAAAVVDELVRVTGRLDMLFNNAGSPIRRTTLEDCPLDLWRAILDTNLTSAFLVTRRAVPALRTSGRGSIVNNLSLSVQTGGANGAGAYAIAKGGLQVMTRTLARELAPLVRVNSVMPGVIETRHHEVFSTPERMAQYRQETPLGRNGTAEDVAEAVVFLLGDGSAFLTGATIDINGGRFLR